MLSRSIRIMARYLDFAGGGEEQVLGLSPSTLHNLHKHKHTHTHTHTHTRTRTHTHTGYLDLAGGGEEEVLGLHVAVHHRRRLPVQVQQPARAPLPPTSRARPGSSHM